MRYIKEQSIRNSSPSGQRGQITLLASRLHRKKGSNFMNSSFHPSNLQIVGVEITQATQFFRLGSGVFIGHFISSIAFKNTTLRVYVNLSSLPQYPMPSSVTGTLLYKPFGADSSTPYKSLSPINGPIPTMRFEQIDRGNPNHTLNFRLPAADCDKWNMPRPIISPFQRDRSCSFSRRILPS